MTQSPTANWNYPTAIKFGAGRSDIQSVASAHAIERPVRAFKRLAGKFGRAFGDRTRLGEVASTMQNHIATGGDGAFGAGAEIAG